MGLRAKHFVIAVSVTTLDFVVAVRYGVVVWRAFSGIILSRITLLFLVTLWATTLLDLWSRALYELRNEARVKRMSPRLVAAPAELREDRDV